MTPFIGIELDRRLARAFFTLGFVVSTLAFFQWPNPYTMTFSNTFLVVWVFHLVIYGKLKK